MRAVDQTGEALAHVPVHMRDYNMCTAAAFPLCADMPTCATCDYSAVPDAIKTKEFYTRAVELNGWNIEGVPDEFKSVRVCDLALASIGADALAYVPNRVKKIID